MATTVLTPVESFLYPFEKTSISCFSWLSVVEDMDRFYPSKQQQESWSRNFKWPPRTIEASHSSSQLSTATVPSVYSTCISNEGTKVSLSSCSRSKIHRDHVTRRDSPCGQGITLRPEDLLISSDNRLPLSPYSVYEWSNSLVPISSPRINPSAYLLPSIENTRHDSRRFALGGSASELYVTAAPQTQLARRRSEGNYENHNGFATPEIRMEAPRATGCPPVSKNAKKMPPLRTRESLDASDSSIASSFAGKPSSSRHARDRDDATSYTAAAAPDGDTFSSASATTSGLDNAPTSTASSSRESSTDDDSDTDDSTKRCCCCRLSSESGSSEVCCCCQCSRSRGGSSPCSCCSSPKFERATTKTPRQSGKKLVTADYHGASGAQKSPIRTRNFAPGQHRVTQNCQLTQQKLHSRNHLAQVKNPRQESRNKSPSPRTKREVSTRVSPSRFQQDRRQTTVFPILITRSFDERTPRRSEAIEKLETGNAHDGYTTAIRSTRLRNPSPRRSSSTDKQTMYSRSPGRTRKGKLTTDRYGDDEDGERINLRVYSPNPIPRYNVLSNGTRYRTRSLQRLDNEYCDTSTIVSGARNNVPLEYDLDVARRRRRSCKNSGLAFNITEGGSIPNKRANSHSGEYLNYQEQQATGGESSTNQKEAYDMLQLTYHCESSEEVAATDFPRTNDKNSPKIVRVHSTESEKKRTRRDNQETDQLRSTTDVSPHKKRSENTKKASKILHTKVTLVKREAVGQSSKVFSGHAAAAQNAHVTVKNSTDSARQSSRPSTGEKLPASSVQNLASGGHSSPRAKRTEPGTSGSVVIDVPDDPCREESDKGSCSSSNSTVRTIIDMPSSSSSPPGRRRSEVGIDIPEDPGGGRPQVTGRVVDVSGRPLTSGNRSTESSGGTDVSEKSGKSRSSNYRKKGRNERMSVDSIEGYPQISTTVIRTTLRQMSEDFDPRLLERATSMKDTKHQAVNDGEHNDCEECRCSTCPVDDSTTKDSEGATLSEEECALCRREKSKKRVLSPKVLVLRASPTRELEEPPELKDKRQETNTSPTPDQIRVLPAAPKSPSPDSAVVKPKSPGYLSVDFPFEPEIIHKANPLVDEAEDEECERKLGSPFRRLSEEEFIATLSIHEAAGKGDLHLIKLLVKKDRKQMETVDERGWTPIHIAAAHGHGDIVKYLSQEGAHLAALDPSSYTAIHLASMNGHNSCVEALLHMGVDVDCVTAEGFTSLHLAAMNGHIECCQTLLYWGASLEKKDALGRRVQDMVEEYGLTEVAELIYRFQRQLKKFHNILKMIQPQNSGNWGDSLMASLSRLKESEIPKDILDMLTSLSEDSGPE